MGLGEYQRRVEKNRTIQPGKGTDEGKDLIGGERWDDCLECVKRDGKVKRLFWNLFGRANPEEKGGWSVERNEGGTRRTINSSGRGSGKRSGKQRESRLKGRGPTHWVGG